MAFNSFGVSRTQAAAGKVKLLAILRDDRHPGAPNVPTMKEILPGYQPLPNWFGFFGPAAMPPAVTQRLGTEIANGLRAPDVVSKIEEAGLVLIASSPEQFAGMVQSSFDVFAKAVKVANLQPQ